VACALTWLGVAGAALALVIGLVSRRRAGTLIAVSLLAMGRYPWAAFVKGHPFRIRYMVPLVAMEGRRRGHRGRRRDRAPRADRVRYRAADPRRLRAPPARCFGADGRRSAMGSPNAPAARASPRAWAIAQRAKK